MINESNMRQRRDIVGWVIFAGPLLVAGLVLAACGKKSAPKHPDDAEYPREYPRALPELKPYTGKDDDGRTIGGINQPGAIYQYPNRAPNR
jgi:hypothetical protein